MQRDQSRRWRPWLGRSRWLATAAALAAVGAVGLWSEDAATWVWVDTLVLGLGYAGSAYAVLMANGRDRVGLVLAGMAGLILASAAARALANWGVGPAGPATEVMFLTAVGVFAPAAVALFPTGGLPGPVIRGCAAVAVGAGAVSAAAHSHPTIADGAAVAAGSALLVGGWVRFVGASGRDRRALLWLAWGCGTTVIVIFHLGFAVEALAVTLPAWAIVIPMSLMIPPVSATIALVDPDWVDIRWLIRCTAVWTATLELAAAAVAGALATLEIIAGGPPGRGGATAVCVLVAAVFSPTMRQVEIVLDDVLFGGRADPVLALTGLGEQLDAGSGPGAWLPALRAGLALPYLELWHRGQRVAVAGTPSPATTAVSLIVRDEHVGELVVGLPPQVSALPPATSTVLRLVATPLAQALSAAHLAEQLQVSRGHIVAALEDERRRLRRDLHDGLGPILAGVAYSADAARNLVPSDPVRAQGLLVELRADTTAAISEIRRIVYGLRPPALDELGLIAAIRQRTQRLSAADGRPVVVEIDQIGELPALPAAVEVAAYRIAVEAVTNAARHSGSTHVRVRIQVTTAVLSITVDDGGTTTTGWKPGVGIQSMRERAEQVGGTLTAAPHPGGGRVHADLPLLPPVPAPGAATIYSVPDPPAAADLDL